MFALRTLVAVMAVAAFAPVNALVIRQDVPAVDNSTVAVNETTPVTPPPASGNTTVEVDVAGNASTTDVTTVANETVTGNATVKGNTTVNGTATNGTAANGSSSAVPTPNKPSKAFPAATAGLLTVLLGAGAALLL